MRKSNAIRAIKDIGKYHTDTVNKIQTIRNSTVYSDEYKAAAIEKIMTEYNDKCERYITSAKDAVEAIQSGFDEKRQAEIKRGLESAETVDYIVNGIKGGIYSADMLRDLVKVHTDNPYASQAIRGALMSSDNDDYRLIGVGIPLTNDDRISHNLDRIINGLKEIPSPTATENGLGNFNVGLFQSGQTFDSWAEYIDSNIDDD